MLPNKTPRYATAIASVLLTLGLAACGDDTTGPNGPDAILGTWNVTSFGDGTTDLIADGMTLVVALDDDGTYTFTVTNDQADICGGNPGDDCTTTGSFTYTVSTVTINDDDPQDATTFTYGMGVGNNNVMTWTGNIGGSAVELDFTRTS